MTEYLVKYTVLKQRETLTLRPMDLLETLYATERSGPATISRPLARDMICRSGTAWIDRKLAELERFMAIFAREKMAMWGSPN